MAGFRFLDLMYDTDLGLDWTKDSIDGGWHLNALGARKVSDYFASFLQNELRMTAFRSQEYDDDITIYDSICKVIDLQSIADLNKYLQYISNVQNHTVFLAARDDMMTGLSDEEIEGLHDLGLKTEFDGLVYSDAFLAVIDNGTVAYEASSNRALNKEGALQNGDR